MENDISLYKEFLLGNQKAFDTLMDKYRNNLICFIQGFVKNIDIAEDLAQDVFVYVLINRKEYDFKYSMKTYLYTIARSRAINYLKREKKVISLEEHMLYRGNEEIINQIEEKILLDDNKKRIHNAIKKLKDTQQRVIYLADIEELSYAEISKVIGKNLSQTKMIIYRARKNLKEILRKEEMRNG